jgi:hypothetical protein
MARGTSRLPHPYSCASVHSRRLTRFILKRRFFVGVGRSDKSPLRGALSIMEVPLSRTGAFATFLVRSLV